MNTALESLVDFHGHRCWASTAGMRAGQAALRALNVNATGGKALHAVVEIGDHHGGMCFADGIQMATGCTYGKGNITKSNRGKLAVRLVDPASDRSVRVAYRPTLQSRIKATAFMRKRAAGVPPTEIPDAEQEEVVTIVWDAAEHEVLDIGSVEPAGWTVIEEVVRFSVCPKCQELIAEPYLRVANGEVVCLDCADYPV